MINFSLCTPDTTDSTLSLVKFLLPLDHDALSLPATLALIDTVCHRGALAHEVVAVDDASRDATAAEARRFTHFMPLWLIQHARPLGRTAAFRTAIEAACRDACDDDLLVPIDPRRRPDPWAVLSAIRAARNGWSAVLSPSAGVLGRGRTPESREDAAVFRAGLIKRHLKRFLETAPAADSEALRQLDRFLLSAGVAFHRLPAPLPPRPVLYPALGERRPVLESAAADGNRG